MQLQRIIRLLAISLGIGSLTLTGCSSQTAPVEQAQAPSSPAEQSPSPNQSPTPSPVDPVKRDVVYVPTPQEVVDRMLELGKVTKDDVLYDLGSGDGRIVVTAAKKYGARATGIEIDPELIKKAQENAKQAGVNDKVKFLNQDLFKTDFSDATVMTLYLLPTLNVKLRPRLLKELKPGTRIVSHDFDMGEWKPEITEKVNSGGREHIIYVWRVPEKAPENLLR